MCTLHNRISIQHNVHNGIRLAWYYGLPKNLEKLRVDSNLTFQTNINESLYPQ